MPDSLKELESNVLDISVGAFDAFCEDIAGMFGIAADGSGGDKSAVTLKDLKTDFKKITAVFMVEAKGAINGTFYIVLNQDALFTLAGTFVMLPEKVIIKNRKTGREQEAKDMEDAATEVGNLLIGAWDRFFREENHEHFLQTGTFIGKPWLKPEETLGLDSEAEMVAVKYESIIEPYAPFNCCAVFPKAVFDPPEEAQQQTPEKSETKEDKSPEEEKTADSAISAETEQAEPKQAQAEQEPEPKSETVSQPQNESEPEPETTANVEDKSQDSAADTESQAQPEAENPAEQTQYAQEPQQQDTSNESDTDNRPVSSIIAQMTKSPAVLPGELNGDMLNEITARKVMRPDITWSNQDDTVEETLAKMQQQNAGYALVRGPEKINGIVSKSDIKGALSPYLQSIFSKWKRELDTATLQIKIRWIMSRPVHTVCPDATLAEVMETMSKHSVRALPVVDENGTCGIVTAYSIFNALTAANDQNNETPPQNTDVPALA